MFSLNAILLPREGADVLAYFGKGKHEESAVRSRLLPEHESATILLGRPSTSRPPVDVHYLMLLDDIRHTYGEAKPGWIKLNAGLPALMMEAVTRSMSERPPEFDAAMALTTFRRAVGVDGGVLAAMLSCERTRLHRLERGKAPITMEEYRRLRRWAWRLGWISQFREIFDRKIENFGGTYMEASLYDESAKLSLEA